MSLSTLPIIVDRIKTATPSSPLAVFKTGKEAESGEELFDGVFAATVATTQRIQNDPAFIGCFYGPDDAEKFKRLDW